MKKVLILALLLNALLLAGRLWQEVEQANAQVATQNGDVNGDSGIDLSDAVYLLSWLFQGGPAPVACANTGTIEEQLAQLSNAVDELSADVANLTGTVDGIDTRVVTLEGTPSLTLEQSEILGAISLVDLPDGQGGTARTIRITGVTLQILNGLGATNGNPANPDAIAPDETTTNSVGNLIVGYNEERPLGQDNRVGSHNC